MRFGINDGNGSGAPETLVMKLHWAKSEEAWIV